MRKLFIIPLVVLGVMLGAAKCPPPKVDAPVPSKNTTDKVEIAWTIDDGTTQNTELGRYDHPIAQWDLTIDRFSKDHKKASLTADRNYIGHIECSIWYFHDKLAYVADFAVNDKNLPAKCEITVQEIDVLVSKNFGDPQPWDKRCPCNPAEDQLRLVVNWTLVG